MFHGGDDDEEELCNEDVIPGDNDKPSEEKQPGTDAPVNLTKIPASDLPTSEDLGGE